jgi:hypothetical protein
MKTTPLLGIALSAFALLIPSHLLAQAAPEANASTVKATLNDFRWIAGHWTGTGLGGVSEELWSPPAGGAMMGSFRQLRDGRVEFYEFLTLVERNGTVFLRLKHFHPDLRGWEDKDQSLEFPLVELTPTGAVFSAMTFTHESTDAFRVSLRLRDRTTGALRDELFDFKRVPSGQ